MQGSHHTGEAAQVCEAEDFAVGQLQLQRPQPLLPLQPRHLAEIAQGLAHDHVKNCSRCFMSGVR